MASPPVPRAMASSMLSSNGVLGKFRLIPHVRFFQPCSILG
jgi:hypothetical protein